MENKKEAFKLNDLAIGFNGKSDDSSWIIAMGLIMALFSSPSFGYKGQTKETDIESRLSKLEAKTDLIEKIILK